jgi:uncharacterized protein YggE
MLSKDDTGAIKGNDMATDSTDGSTNKSRRTGSLSLSLDYRILCLVLLAVIVAMLALWRPWSANASGDRTIDVTGQTTVKSEPDEYVFYPNYEINNVDRAGALSEVTAKSDGVIKGLKEVGVADRQIKTNASDFGSFKPMPERDGSSPSYNLVVTVTVGTKELAQKVQDYLLTTGPGGTITPQATFSEAKRKELESKARDEATKDARAKAEQSAKNLGFKVGAVKKVSDSNGFGVYPMVAQDSISSSGATRQMLAVQPGENELSYSVTVTYYLK